MVLWSWRQTGTSPHSFSVRCRAARGGWSRSRSGLCFKWDRFIREPLDLQYLIPQFDKAGSGLPRWRGTSTWAPTPAGSPRGS